MSDAIDFFDRQFRRQAAAHDFALNPFETLALTHGHGELLDLGCGLGNFALAAAQRGCRVLALDASPTAIDTLRMRAAAAGLAIEADLVDAIGYRPARSFDTIACIGLLMFLPCDAAEALLERLQTALRPGGTMIVNVLVRGTTYLDMFGADPHCLFDPERVDAWFAAWQVLAREDARFDAPGATHKCFRTVVARKPVATPETR